MVWMMLGTIAVAKLATLVIVLWLSHSRQGLAMAVATMWFWVIVAGVLCSGSLLFRWRLYRVRARREALRRGEWLLDDPRPLEPQAASFLRRLR